MSPTNVTRDDSFSNITMGQTEARPANTSAPDFDFASNFPFSVGLAGVDQERNFIAINVMAAIVVIVMIITLGVRVWKILHTYSRQLAVMANPERQTYWKTNRNSWWPWLKAHFFYAPLWKNRHNQEIALSKAITIGTLPGRSHFTLLLIYSLFTIAWTVTLPYQAPKREVIAALRGRSGLIAVFNLFPAVTFALRNNPLITLLHVPFDTFQLFHRWSARIFILESIIHTLAWVGNTGEAGGVNAVAQGLTKGIHAPSYAWGLVGTIAAVIILFQAWSPVRHAFYETFLCLHKLLVFLVLVGTFLHLKLDNLPLDLWLVAILCIWAYDYVIRLFRIWWTNWTRTTRSSRVVVTAMSSGACRVTFHLPTYWAPRPGTHVHVYIPQFGYLQSHPFSVAWTETYDVNRHISPLSSPRLPLSRRDTGSESKLEMDDDYEPTLRSTVSLICRSRTGFTKNMWDSVMAMENRTCETYGFLEGFYGGHDDLASYGDVALFAGGVGITHQIMFCKQLIEGYTLGTMACRRVTLVWSIPTKDCLEWVEPWMNDILNMENRRVVVRIMIFVTREKVKDDTSKSGQVTLRASRCPIDQILGDVIRTRRGAVAVTVCGPGAFADAVRNATRKRVKRGVIDFMEEAFTY